MAKSEVKPEASIISSKINTGIPPKSKSFTYWTRQHHDIGRPSNFHHGHYHSQHKHYTTGGFIKHGQNVHHFLDDPVHGPLSHPLAHTQFYHQNIHPLHPPQYHHHRQYPHDGHVSHTNDVNLGHILNYQLKQPIYHHHHSHSHSHPHPGHNTHLHHTHSHTHGTSGYEVHAPNYIVWNYRN